MLLSCAPVKENEVLHSILLGIAGAGVCGGVTLRAEVGDSVLIGDGTVLCRFRWGF